MTTTTPEKNYLIGYHNRLCADGIKSMISDFLPEVVVSIERNGSHMLSSIRSKSYSLIIIDIEYPGCDTIEYLSEIKKAGKHAKVLLISDLIQNGMLVDILNTGVEGYILHTCNMDDLETAISKIMGNEHYICTSITTQVLQNMKISSRQSQNILMTAREKEILSYLIKMYSNKSIAEKLNISELTVKTHRKNLMKKFGSKNLLALVRYACRENLISGDDDEFCRGCPHRFCFNYN
jgi:DNA-binding NarL/FixJ family response regulator